MFVICLEERRRTLSTAGRAWCVACLAVECSRGLVFPADEELVDVVVVVIEGDEEEFLVEFGDWVGCSKDDALGEKESSL